MIPLSDLPYLEWTDPDSGATSRIYADTIKSESANLPAVVTKHAVETGANITDHYRKDLETVRLVMFFSGSPIRGDLDPDSPGTVQPKTLTYPASQGGGASIFTPGGLTQAVGGALSSALGIGPAPPPKQMNVLAFDSPPKPLQKVIEKVRDLQTRGILVTVRTTVGPFENCAIETCEISRQPEHGDGGDVTFSVSQVRSVSSDIALALPLPAEPRGIPKKTAGVSGTADVSAGDQKSVTAALLDHFGVKIPGT